MQPGKIARNLAFLSLCAIVGVLGCSLANRQDDNGADFRTVTRAVEGDTLLMSNGERVRLIGVDTPESEDPRRPVQYYANESTAFTKHLAEGRRVRLEYDKRQRCARGTKTTCLSGEP
jgi:micrococcal nuclease